MPYGGLARFRVPALAGAATVAAAIAAAVVLDFPLPGRDAGADVQAVVQQQLTAFERGDAQRAFALADDSMRERFGNAEHFMAMVRAHYPMVHRPASVAFLPAERSGDLVFQKVRMTDTEGASWLVTYLLQRQGDRQWRISACLVVPDTPKLNT